MNGCRHTAPGVAVGEKRRQRQAPADLSAWQISQ